jgi:hypothetical protein
VSTRKSVDERRRSPRVRSTVPVKIICDDGDIVTQTVNISRSGVYCQVNRQVEVMTKLKVCLLIPIKKLGKASTRRISCQGVVVRAEPISGSKTYNVAVFFNDIAQRDADSIADYVSSHLDQQV